MKVLIIGGTGFLGRYLVSAAQARNHDVTLFNRGQSNPDLFPQMETIIGDREQDLDKLSDRQWNAVIDTCGYVPRVVRLSAEALRDSVERYIYISSTTRYRDFNQIGIDESYPGRTMPDESNENVGEFYAALKVLCEKTTEAIFPNRALIVIPHFLVGPQDPKDRFTYWPVRVARGGDVLAPVGPSEPCQFIDVRDISEWIIHMLETNATGRYNACGPDDSYTFGQLLETCKQVSGSDARFRWASAEFLEKHDVAAWRDFPIWFSPDWGIGPARLSIAKARAAGLTFRPVAETVRDTLDWVKTLPADHQWQVGLSAEKESKVLAEL
jgi:2'-hydroxyisoflavone reductase